MKISTTLLHCLKKVPTFKLSVTLSNVNRYLKLLHCWKAYEICYKSIRHYPPHLRHVATLPWEIKNAIFCRYSAHMKEKANKFYFYRVYPFYSLTSFDIFGV